MENNSTRSDKSLGRASAPQWSKEGNHPYLLYEHGQLGCKGLYERQTLVDLVCPHNIADTQQVRVLCGSVCVRGYLCIFMCMSVSVLLCVSTRGV